MVGWTLDIHLFFVFAMLLIPVHNLIVLYTVKDFPRLAYRVRIPGPMYHFFCSATIFTGVIIMFLTKVYYSFDILLMSVAVLLVMGLEIKRFKMVKNIYRNQVDLQIPFIAFARKKYIFDLVLMVSVIALVWK